MSTLDVVVALSIVLGIVSSALVAFLPNVLHAAIALVFSLMSVAFLYGALGADFLAAAQFVIYIGGTIIVIIFAIMMTPGIYQARFLEGGKKYVVPALLAVGAAALLIGFISKTPWMGLEGLSHEPTTLRMGLALSGPYVLAFEFMAVLLLLGLVGAVVVARQEKKS